jgi:SpoVK/Ycf46/Vps4 family AAA+-type ATPase
MTANSLHDLPVEFIRRVNERFFFDMPTEDERVDILKIHLKKQNQSTDSLNLADLAMEAKQMVGSEIEQAIQSALVESFDAGCEGLSPEILSSELKKKPRIFKTLSEELKEILNWVGWDPDCQDGIRARWASEPSPEFLASRQKTP